MAETRLITLVHLTTRYWIELNGDWLTYVPSWIGEGEVITLVDREDKCHVVNPAHIVHAYTQELVSRPYDYAPEH